jgi:serine/threonine protein kinase
VETGFNLVCPRCLDNHPEGEEVCPRCGSNLCDPEDLARIGQRLHNYEIQKIIGIGGMGVVYRAKHVSLLRSVAVKILNDRYGRRKDSAREMLREAQAASRIRHPNIVDVTDFGNTPDGAAYFVMEYLEGESLAAALVRQGRLPVARSVHIARQVASALAAAHNTGIVHRDLKPENIFLLREPGGPQTDNVKLLDFGLAKVMDMGPSSRTRAGVLAGTPWYMSPEQAQNRAVDTRSDVYSLGVVLYQMVTGTLPFDGPSTVDILMAHISAPPVQPYKHNAAIDEETNRLILCCMEKDPDHRYQSMEEVCAALDRCGTDLRLEAGDLLPELAAAPLASGAATVTSELMDQVLSPSPSASHDSSSESPAPAAGAGPVLRPTVTSEIVQRLMGAPSGQQQPSSASSAAAASVASPSAPESAVALEVEAGDADAAASQAEPAVARPLVGPARTSRRRLVLALGLAAGVAALALPLLLTRSPQRSAPRPPAPEARTIQVHLDGLPAGAKVFLDGEPVQQLPLSVRRSSSTHRLVVKAAGYLPAARSFVASSSQRLGLMLSPEPRPMPVVLSPTPGKTKKTRRHRPRRRGKPRPKAASAKPPGKAKPATPVDDEGAIAKTDEKEAKAAPSPAPAKPPKSKPEAKPEPKRPAKKKYTDWVVDPF